MNFKLTKEQENFKMRVREITEKYVTPYAAENDKHSSFSKSFSGNAWRKRYNGNTF